MKGSDKKFNTEFEEAWQNAFEDAEVSPPPHVWENLHGKMAHADSLRYKNYYLIYRSLTVAASMLAAAFIFLYYVEKQDLANIDTTQPTPNSSAQISVLSEQEERQRRFGLVPKDSILIPNQPLAKNPQTGISQANVFGEQNHEKSAIDKPDQLANTAQQNLTATPNIQPEKNTINSSKTAQENRLTNRDANSPNQKTLSLSARENTLPSEHQTIDQTPYNHVVSTSEQNIVDRDIDRGFVSIIGPNSVESNLQLQAIEIDNVLENSKKAYSKMPKLPETSEAALVAKVAKRAKSPKAAPEKTLYEQQGKLFANLNLGSAMFQPNFSSNGPSVVNIANLNPNQMTTIKSNTRLGEKQTPTVSVTYGIRMGMRLSRKFILEGGVTYATYNTTSKTDVVWGNHERVTPIILQNNPTHFSPYGGQDYLALDKEYELNNAFEFASVPVQTGYVIGLSKHLNWIWKAGVCTDIFMRNEITSSNKSLDTYTIQRSESASPFRKMVFNGSLANEINYSLNQNYSFALEANYRFALNSFTQQHESFKSLPETYGLGMVIRYHFN